MKKILLPLLVVILGALAIWAVQRKNGAPPQVPFAKTSRQTISNILSTNGKVEPVEYMDVRVETRGLVKRVLVHAGDAVRSGQVLAELSEPGLEEQIQAARAREAGARADLQTLQAGGSSAEIGELEGSLSRLRSDREAAQKNLEALQRLQQKQAATAFEVDQASQSVKSFDVQIQSLEKRRTSLVGKGDIAGAQARVDEAQANVQLSISRVGQDFIRAPMAGIVYDLPARAGAWLNPGDPIASVGRLDPVHVRVYVDEPDLGRVATGEHVRITWDALPGREWNGTVEKRPTEVIALGSREVGEVLCTIDNPNRELTPGTNVNAFILTQTVTNALTIPKSAVRRDNGVGVFALEGDRIKWRPVTTGTSNALSVEILTGLKDGDSVAEPTDHPLKNDEKVTPGPQ